MNWKIHMHETQPFIPCVCHSWIRIDERAGWSIDCAAARSCTHTAAAAAAAVSTNQNSPPPKKKSILPWWWSEFTIQKFASLSQKSYSCEMTFQLGGSIPKIPGWDCLSQGETLVLFALIGEFCFCICCSFCFSACAGCELARDTTNIMCPVAKSVLKGVKLLEFQRIIWKNENIQSNLWWCTSKTECSVPTSKARYNQ